MNFPKKELLADGGTSRLKQTRLFSATLFDVNRLTSDNISLKSSQTENQLENETASYRLTQMRMYFLLLLFLVLFC